MTDRQARLIGSAVIFLAGAILWQNPPTIVPGIAVALASGIAFVVDFLRSGKN